MITIQADVPPPPGGYEHPVLRSCVAPRDALVWKGPAAGWGPAAILEEPLYWLIAFKSKPWVPEHWAGREVFEIEEGKWPQHPPGTKVFALTWHERRRGSYQRTGPRRLGLTGSDLLAAYTLMQPGEEDLSL